MNPASLLIPGTVHAYHIEYSSIIQEGDFGSVVEKASAIIWNQCLAHNAENTKS